MPSSTPLHLQWQSLRFAQLGTAQLYALLKLRTDVFVVEQRCAYPELDGKDTDPGVLHLLGTTDTGELAAYLRVLPPGLSYPEPSIGRVVIGNTFRGRGLAHALMQHGLQLVHAHWPGSAIQLGAGASASVLRRARVCAGIGTVSGRRHSPSRHAAPCRRGAPGAHMITTPDYRALLDTAIAEARQGLAEGGIPIGAALYHNDGRLLGCGHNRRVQENDPSVHGETDAFRKAGRQRRYKDTIMVTTLAPCWYCSGLVRQFNIGTVVVGESVTFQGGVAWLREHGVNVIDLQSQECIDLLGGYIAANPEVWNEDIGED